MLKGRVYMYIAAIIIGIIILLFLLLWFTSLSIYLNLYHGQDNDHFQIQFKIWFGLIRYKVDIPMVQIDKDQPDIVLKQEVKKGKKEKVKKASKKRIRPSDILNSFQDTAELIRHVYGTHVIVNKFLAKIKVRNLQWHTLIGLKDAAATGMLAGAAWTLKSTIITFISTHCRLMDPPVIEVIPSFNRPISQISFKCMFRFRIGHAIFAGLKLIKYWNGGKPQFKTKPLSILSEEKNKHSL
ncbi:DUF2953 domain-containing protein [Falsibacillus pallidus]|uniref:DUF2953 family protein n=1 Tax=Falsibacillus pallidus TaxID=493781 RepID=A0A370GKJ0_9BACI|nr:DUF2953 domain-containing protein [Falsibacillus pallidus]RDI44278.1 DUF2953 family protein [Falsibacillus pallidus]